MVPILLLTYARMSLFYPCFNVKPKYGPYGKVVSNWLWDEWFSAIKKTGNQACQGLWMCMDFVSFLLNGSSSLDNNYWFLR